MCKKQTSVSHSSTESEIISLDTGLRLDGLPALELWDLIVSVLGIVSRVSDRSGKPESDDHKSHKSHKKIDVMEDIDSVPSNVQSSRQEALLYVFEDNEAVIEMINKGRSPTMRHVSRTHRVALDWLFDRINLDSKMARGMGSPRQVLNRRRRTREGPELACVRAPSPGVAHAGGKDELTSCRGTVQSAWQKPPVSREGGRAGLPARVSGRHVVRGRQSSPVPAQASRVSVAVMGAPG